MRDMPKDWFVTFLPENEKAGPETNRKPADKSLYLWTFFINTLNYNTILSIIISCLLFFFTIREKPEEKKEELPKTFSLDLQQQDSNIINQTPNENNIIEMPTPNSEINTGAVNGENNLSLGMSEKDSL